MTNQANNRIGNYALELCPLRPAQFVDGVRLRNAEVVALGVTIIMLAGATGVGAGVGMLCIGLGILL